MKKFHLKGSGSGELILIKGWGKSYQEEY